LVTLEENRAGVHALPNREISLKTIVKEAGVPQNNTAEESAAESAVENGEAQSPRASAPFRFSSGPREQKNPHEGGLVTYARVYVNDLGEPEVAKENPVFPVGTVFVREKLWQENDQTPALLTVMVKREKGFSKKTNDWEFLTLDGATQKLQKREKTGSCSKCHAGAQQTDFVFKTYLKN
jgi:hypothetical protein